MAAIPDVSTATIAIVGGCCAGLIVLLSMVLLYFCCRRRRHYKEMEPGTQQQRQQQQQHLQQQDSPTESSLQQPGRYHMASDGKPYALVPPHPSMSADNVTCISGSRRSSSLVTSAAVVSKAPESGDGIDLGAAGPPVPARGGGVFATLRSGHNPLDSSASNPAIFNYSQDYPDDNRNTDPYNFESGYRSSRKIVYEVVV